MAGDFDVLRLFLLESDSKHFSGRVSGSTRHGLKVKGEAPDGLLRFAPLSTDTSVLSHAIFGLV